MTPPLRPLGPTPRVRGAKWRPRGRHAPLRPDELPGLGITGVREDPRTTRREAERAAALAMIQPGAELIAGGIPVLGEGQSARDAFRDFREGRVGWGVFNAIATVPIVGIPLRWVRRGRVSVRNAEMLLRAVQSGEMTAQQAVARARSISKRFGDEMGEFLREGGTITDVETARSLPRDVVERAAKRSLTGPAERAQFAAAREAQAAQRAGPTGPAPRARPQVPDQPVQLDPNVIEAAGGPGFLTAVSTPSNKPLRDLTDDELLDAGRRIRARQDEMAGPPTGEEVFDTGRQVEAERAAFDAQQWEAEAARRRGSGVLGGTPDRRVVAAAVRGADGKVYTGVNHGAAEDAAAQAQRATPEGRAAMQRNGGNAWVRGSDGFVANDTPADEIISRNEAREITARSGQAPQLDPRIPQLHSSDLVAAERSRQLRIGTEAAAAHRAGGSTFDPRTGQNMAGSRRYAVSPFKMRQQVLDRPPTPEDYAQFMEANKDLFEQFPDVLLGSWDDNGRHVLDATILVGSRRQADRIARATGQDGFTFLDGKDFPTTRITTHDPVRAARVRNELLDEIPAFRYATEQHMVANLTPTEAAAYAGRDPRGQRQWLEAFAKSPTPREWASMIDLGYNARDWYGLSRQALAQFGPDAPKFTALLASVSPGIPVDRSLQVALKVWRRTGGNPLTRDQAATMLREIGVGKSAGSMAGNVEKVLGMSSADIARIDITRPGFLSGPKVDPFFANLMGETQRLTFDTHIARAVGTTPKRIGESFRNGGVAASLRAGTAEFNRLSGVAPITPEQAQAAVWEPVRAMTPLVRGGQQVMPEMVRSVRPEDIGTIMAQPELQGLLGQMGLRAPSPVSPGAGLPTSLARSEDVSGFAHRIGIAQRAEQKLDPALFGLAPLAALAATRGSLFGGRGQSPQSVPLDQFLTGQ